MCCAVGGSLFCKEPRKPPAPAGAPQRGHSWLLMCSVVAGWMKQLAVSNQSFPVVSAQTKSLLYGEKLFQQVGNL